MKKRVCGGLCALTVAVAPAVASDLDAAFLILRNGDCIGYHIVDVEETEDGLAVETRIEMRVKFGPFALYRYSHSASELWRDGALQHLSSRTNDDGEKSALEAYRENDHLMIDGDAYRGPAPADAMPTSYWNKAVVASTTMVNTQNGEFIDVEVARLGTTPSPFGSAGEHFRIVGTVTLDIWYDGERWIGSDFVVDGEELTYRPVDSGDDRKRLFAMLK